MSKIDSIVQVQITRETTVPTAAGFGTLLLLGSSSIIPDGVVREYADMDEVSVDFTSSNAEFNFAQTFFGQAIKPEKIKIARAVPNGGAFVLSASGGAADFTVTILGSTVTGATLGDLATAIAGITGVASAVVAATNYIVVTMSAGYAALVSGADAVTGTLVDYVNNISAWDFGAAFATAASIDVDGVTETSVVSYEDLASEIQTSIALDVDEAFVDGNILYVISLNPTPNVLTDGINDGAPAGSALNLVNKTMGDIIGELSAQDSDFYAIGAISTLEVNVLSIAAWTEANTKLFVTRTADTAMTFTPDISSISFQVQSLGYDRTFVCYHEQAATEYLDAAIFGLQLPKQPGSTTWNLKRLAGVTVNNLSGGAVSAIESTNGNYFRRIAGANYFQQGKVASGEWIDIIRGTDQLVARMQERVFTTLANAEKIPYTNRGIGIIEADVRAQLDDAITGGLLASEPEYNVSVPNALNVSVADKGNRILRDVTFTAKYAGAIHKVRIRGTISL